LFEIERGINGRSAKERKAVRQELSAPLVADLEAWMREQRAKLARGNDVAKAMGQLKRWATFTPFLDDRRIGLSNNAAERALRRIALGRRSWMFCGSDRGGDRAAFMYGLRFSRMADAEARRVLSRGHDIRLGKRGEMAAPRLALRLEHRPHRPIERVV
jgi:hypothetical protein